MECRGACVDAGLDCVQILLGDFVFQLSDNVRGLHLGDGALQPQRFLGHLVSGGFRLFGGFQGIGIGGLGAGTLGEVEEGEANADADRGVVLLEAVGWAEKSAEGRGAGLRRDVVVLKIIELGKQSILRREIQAGPKTLMFPLGAQILGAGVFDGGLDGWIVGGSVL